MPQWLKYDFGAGNDKEINYITISNSSAEASGDTVKNAVLQYSDDNSSWTDWLYVVNHTSTVGGSASYTYVDPITGTLSSTLPAPTTTIRLGLRFDLAPPALTIGAYGNNYADIQLSALTFEGRQGAYVALDLPSLNLLATGHSRTSALDATLPSMSLEAYGGASLIQALAALTFEGSGTNPIVGTLGRTLRILTIEASGTTALAATLSATLGALVGTARGGAIGARTMPAVTLDASGTVGSVGGLSRVIPVLTLEASGDVENFGGLDAELPSLQRANAGIASASLPRFTLRATGYLVVDTEYEAWATNLRPGEGMPNQVTEYTNFPFNQIIRYGEDYYGVADDGLYLLGGDTDYDTPAAAAISWSWRTGVTDFGTRQMKVVRQSVQFGRLGTRVTATVAVGEGTLQSYAALIERGSTAQAHRIKYGRGLKGVYWQFGMADANGSAMELDASTYDAQASERKI